MEPQTELQSIASNDLTAAPLTSYLWEVQKKFPGILVTFEGTEGAGKSTLIRAVEERLQLDYPNQAITLTREPGGNPLAERIRALILEHPMHPKAELFLYEAARAEHLATVIVPALKKGAIVLCDRFTDSSLAYQGHARGLPWNEVKALNRAATDGLKPDLTVHLDIDPAVGLGRALERNRFEAEGVKFQQKVRAGFLKARREDPRRWLVVKAASGSPATLAVKVVMEMNRRFRKRLKPGSLTQDG